MVPTSGKTFGHQLYRHRASEAQTDPRADNDRIEVHFDHDRAAVDACLGSTKICFTSKLANRPWPSFTLKPACTAEPATVFNPTFVTAPPAGLVSYQNDTFSPAPT